MKSKLVSGNELFLFDKKGINLENVRNWLIVFGYCLGNEFVFIYFLGGWNLKNVGNCVKVLK